MQNINQSITLKDIEAAWKAVKLRVLVKLINLRTTETIEKRILHNLGKRKLTIKVIEVNISLFLDIEIVHNGNIRNNARQLKDLLK